MYEFGEPRTTASQPWYGVHVRVGLTSLEESWARFDVMTILPGSRLFSRDLEYSIDVGGPPKSGGLTPPIGLGKLAPLNQGLLWFFSSARETLVRGVSGFFLIFSYLPATGRARAARGPHEPCLPEPVVC